MGRRVRQWIGFFIMLAGLGLLAGPFLLGAREERVQEQVVDSFYQDVEKAELSADVTQTQPQTPREPEDAFYQAAKAYNASLFEGGQDAMTNLADVEQFALSALD